MKTCSRVTILAALVLAGATGLSGCSHTVRYGDAQAQQTLSTDFSSSDLQQIAEKMTDSLLTFPPIVEATSQRRPILSMTKVKNKTMQHIDTESVTDSIRTKLIRSGRFQFIDRTTDEEAREEFQAQKDTGLVDPKKAVPAGNQYGAEYLLTANLSEIQQKAGSTTDVYYKFTMNLKNLRTGLLEWSDEKEIRKIGKRAVFGP
jgi:uncharacterized protein (TIGR02722 family)